MLWLQHKYALLLSNQLPKFKKKSDVVYNFRCVFCGDSKVNRSKTRGYLIVKTGKLVFYCHNCNKSYQFDTFLKLVNVDLYNHYLHEKLEANDNHQQIAVEQKIPVVSNKSLSILKKISQLSPDHIAKKYCVSRQIPTPYHSELFYCRYFKKWTNSIIPNKFESLENDHARLIIPLLDSNNVMFGYQGRAFDNNQIRYITISIDTTKPAVYGLNRCNTNFRFYCFEGPIDSMFIKNSIATCGGDIISQLDRLHVSKDNCTIVFDNEPRSKHTVEKMLTAVDNQYKVFVWPSDVVYKDINEIICSKVSGDYCKTELVENASQAIKQMIDSNTYSGLDARLRISQWRKG